MRVAVIILIMVVFCAYLPAQTNEDPLCIGCPAPTFSLPTLEQEYVSLRDFCGEKLRKPWINKIKQIVVISFFATWCEPCKKEIPYLTRLKDEYRDKPVKFFLIDVGEEPEKISQFIADEKIELPVLIDRYKKTAEKYDALVLPRLYVLDKNGRIQRKQRGFLNPEDFEIEMREIINMLLVED